MTFTLFGDGDFASTISVTPSADQWTVSSCTVNGSGTFVIKASAADATDAYSETFEVASGDPVTITFLTVPSTVYRGVPVDFIVNALDSNGGVVNTAETATLKVSSGPGSIVVGATSSFSAVDTLFSGVIFSKAGSYSVTVDCANCAGASITPETVIVLAQGEVIISLASFVKEGGGGQKYTVSLSSAPTAPVSVQITSRSPLILVLLTSSLALTTGDYIGKEVSFDIETYGEPVNPLDVLILHSFSSDDWRYNGDVDYQCCLVVGADIALPIYGYEEYSIETEVVVGVEEGGSTEFLLFIGRQPDADIVVTPSLSDATFAVAPTSITFTSSDWAPKPIVVTAPASVSTVETKTITYAVATTATGFTSPIWRPSSQQTTVVITDSGARAILLEVTSLALLELRFGYYHVSLATVPDDTSTVTLTAGSQLTVSPTTIEFTPSDYFIPRRVTVFTDLISTPPSTDSTITHQADSSYSSVAATLTVTIGDYCYNEPYVWPKLNSCECPAGFNCEGNVPILCSAGTYSATGQSDCTPCPAGKYCDSPSASESACGSGEYSFDYATYCSPCPAGFACPTLSGYDMKRCPPGETSAKGSVTCSSPTSPNVFLTTEDASSFVCPAGYFSDGVKDFCVPCPAGYNCASGTPTVCLPGTYCLEGMGVSSCITCPEHYECDAALGPIRICPEGTYRVSTEAMCKLCEEDNKCTAAEPTRKVACASTESAPVGSSICKSKSGTEFEKYPGIQLDANGDLEKCSFDSASGLYDCFLGGYTAFRENIQCDEGWGRCYPIPGGEKQDGTVATNNQFSLIGSNVLTTAFIGFILPERADRPDIIGFECPPRHYCDGTTSTTTVCPDGTYNRFVRATDSSYCSPCPPGYDCRISRGDLDLHPCPFGSYCPNESQPEDPIQCPERTFNPKLRAIAEGSCMQCWEGYYCEQGNQNPEICSVGKICPVGSYEELKCPEGSYNSYTGKYKMEDCLMCPAGYYCGESQVYPVPCSPGTYQPYAKAPAAENCLPCTAGYACIGTATVKPYIKCEIGYYCPVASKIPITFPCPPGTIGLLYGAYSVSQCDRCPAGFACGFATNYVNNPPIVCPAGYYCPQDTEQPYQYPCAVGTFNEKTRREGPEECRSCLPGYFCLQATATIPSEICPKGHYCPAGTTYAEENPCPAGTYNDVVGMDNLAQCLLCIKGNYCPAGIGATGILPCPVSTYMDEFGAKGAGPGKFPSCKPCRPGTYQATPGQTSCTSALAGKYSRENTNAEVVCKIGYFCAEEGTSELIMFASPCPAGYYCVEGTNSYPDLSKQCIVGHYCPEATSTQLPCPPGTYRTTTGAKSEYECTLVPAGQYTDLSGQSTYLDCATGHYCPEGSVLSTQEACPAGTYRSKIKGKSASDCGACTAGFYCADTGMSTPVNCPVGKYCPEGTITPLLCPKGSFSNTEGRSSSSDCTPCEAGKYCESPGGTVFTDLCEEGFFCIAGAYLSAPVDGVTGDLCPAGGFCLEGTPAPSPCPVGKFNNFPGGRSDADCVECWPGYYCESSSDPEPTGLCSAGYYCIGSSTSATQHSTTQGHYTPAGSVGEIPCQYGSYNPSAVQSKCLSCESGKYCQGVSLIVSDDCPVGSYCPSESFVPLPCPTGTYRDTSGAASIDECLSCDGTKFCEEFGLAASSVDTCDVGYYCISGSHYSRPMYEAANRYGPCPAGHYCDATQGAPEECPMGKYNPTTHVTSVGDCLPCPAGYACTTTAMTSYDVTECRLGYYCPEDSVTDQPSVTICTAGEYCPNGSAVALKCPAGTYQNNEKQGNCLTCPAGYYCPDGTGDYSANICSIGYYCQAGTKHQYEFPCPPGTFNANAGQGTSAACVDCTPGFYCDKYGASAVTNKCASGYYCSSTSTTPRPPNTSGVGGRCGPGQYCAEGSSNPVACDAGSYCPNDEMTAKGPSCANGYFCLESAITPTPTDVTTGDICTIQYYCQSGGSTKTQCASGTYLPYKGGSDVTECINCTPGSYCDGSDGSEEATVAETLAIIVKDCTVGFYCLGGDVSPKNECTRGEKCPVGSAAAQACPEGTYQDNTQQGACKSCTEGFYCESGAIAETSCPKGHYCPAGTGFKNSHPCPVGTYNSFLGKTDSSACIVCDQGKYCSTLGASGTTGLCDEGFYCTGSATTARPVDPLEGGMCEIGHYCPQGSKTQTVCDPGYYCNSEGLGEPSGLCIEGYFCVSAASTATPTDGTTGDICPEGSYCPAGVATSFFCPKGTVSNSKGLGSLNQCFACPPGEFCSTEGITSISGTCNSGYFCSGGKTTATPNDGVCPSGHYCPTASAVAIPCDKGTYNLDPAKANCVGCDAGKYCEGGTSSPLPCPIGHKCPAGTRFSIEFPCGEGEFNSELGQIGCEVCPEGSECNNGATTGIDRCPVFMYCPAGTGFGSLCDAGTYNPDTEGLTAATECTDCLDGQYCVNGQITGQCEAGYHCTQKSPTPIPIGQSYGDLCEKGGYCSSGTVTVTTCPAGKFRATKGGRQESDCTQCPPGFYCITGNPEGIDCPKGHYCPQSVDSPTPCPKGTYNSNERESDNDACKICPAGYFCDATGIADYNEYPCKEGFFCVEGAVGFTPCPPGTYGPLNTAGAPADCTDCPKGFYCTGGENAYHPCEVGRYCPTGSSEQLLCPPGHICGKKTAEAESCPLDHYCELYDKTDYSQYEQATEPPTPCPANTWCPGGNFSPELCFPGFQLIGNSCVECPVGTFSKGKLSYCEYCAPGYICTGGATTATPTTAEEGGYICPAGAYCYQGAHEPGKCPMGTYNRNEGSSLASECLACPPDTFGNEEGLRTCEVCGSSATSSGSETTCRCIGQFRMFQEYDRSCVCQTQYHFIVEGQDKSEVDSDVDCVPITYKSCPTTKVRKANGNCEGVDSCGDDCENGGEIDNDSALCDCDDTEDPELVCGSECRAILPALSINSAGALVITSVTGEEEEVTLKGSLSLNVAVCKKEKCQVVSIEMPKSVNDRIVGVYGVPDSVSSVRRLQGTTSQAISDPVVCLEEGDSFVFSLAPEHYPVYSKDSLVNTNESFDYSAFLELAWRMKNGVSTVSTFVFTFASTGIYDFVDSQNSDLHLIVGVKSSCPAGQSFYAMTSGTYESFEISKGELEEESPLAEVIVVIIGVFITILLCIGLLAFLHWRSWATNHAKDRLYEMLKNCVKKCNLKTPKRIVKVMPVFDESAELDEELLEPSQFQAIFEKVKQFYDQVFQNLDAQDEDFRATLDELTQEAHALKDLFQDRISNLDAGMLRERLIEPELSESSAEEPEFPEFAQVSVPEEERINEKIYQIFAPEDYEDPEASEVLAALQRPISEEEKAELLQLFAANNQRIEQTLSEDRDKAQEFLRKRLQQRAARKKAAKNEHALYNNKREEMVGKHRDEQKQLKQNCEQAKEEIDKEYAEQREGVEKQHRKELDNSLNSLRMKLQNELADAQDSEEANALMRTFEIEGKRVEDQLYLHKKQQEQELLKRLEDRRRARLQQLSTALQLDQQELEDSQKEKLYQLEQRALVGAADNIEAEIEIDPATKAQLNQLVQARNAEIQELKDSQQQELLQLDNTLDQEQLDNTLDQEQQQHTLEEQQLNKALAETHSQEEREQLLRELQLAEDAQEHAKSQQSAALRQRLETRKLKKAEQEAQLKQRHNAELWTLESALHLDSQQARSELELKKIEELLERQNEVSPEELTALARQILEDKHDRDFAELAEWKAKALRNRQQAVLQDALDRKQLNLQSTNDKFAQLTAAAITKDERNSLLEEQRRELNKEELEFFSSLEKAQENVLRQLEDTYRNKYSALSQDHMREITEILRKIKGADPRLINANMDDMEQEINSAKAEFERNHAARLKQLDEKAREFQAFEKQKQREIADIQLQVQENQNQLEDMEHKRFELAEKQRIIMDAMKERGISPEKMEQMLNQHKSEMEEWERTMETEKLRQKQRLRDKLEEREQKYQQRRTLELQKFKEEKLRVLQAEEEAEKHKLKIVQFTSRELKLFEPKYDIDSQLSFPELKKLTADADGNILEHIVQRVRRVEGIVENIDVRQFQQLMTAFKEVNQAVSAIKSNRT